MKNIQMQILLPHLIAIPDGVYEVYAARHLRTLHLSQPTQISHDTEFGQEVLPCLEQSLVSMDFETDRDLTETQNVRNEFARCTNITLTTANRLLANFSFRELPNDFWNRLQRSRNARNQVVHQAEEVAEEDAQNALDVTLEFVAAVEGFRNSAGVSH